MSREIRLGRSSKTDRDFYKRLLNSGSGDAYARPVTASVGAISARTAAGDSNETPLTCGNIMVRGVSLSGHLCDSMGSLPACADKRTVSAYQMHPDLNKHLKSGVTARFCGVWAAWTVMA